MTSNLVVLHSLNLRGFVGDQVEDIKSELEVSECAAFLLQDVGSVGLNGNPYLNASLEGHKVLTNFHPSNKSRTVGIVVNKLWNIVGPIFRDDFGCVVATTIERRGSRLLVASVYMPASLNKVGAPKSVDLTNITDSSEVQLEAHNAYGLLKDLTARESHWIIGGGSE